jgi:Mrp family chromosome partitioning ATPase
MKSRLLSPAKWLRRRPDPASPGALIVRTEVEFSQGDLAEVGPLGRRGAATNLREEFRVIKHHILDRAKDQRRSDGGRDARLVVVTSAGPDEGKTFCTLNVGMSLSLDRGVSVTLVDGDVGSRDLSERLGLSSYDGLLDFLDDTSLSLSSVLLPTNVPNVQLLPAGRGRSDATELLDSTRMGQAVSELLGRGSDQIVVFDSNAVLSGSDASILAQYAGQIVFVVAANETRHQDIDDSLALLDRVAGPLSEDNLSFIVNKISPSRSIARYRRNADL